jgi:HEAT repeat protein
MVAFSEKEKGFWLRAIERPEADMRCKAAGAVVLAHRRGTKGLESTIAPLRQVVTKDKRASVQLAAARALVALDARQAAADLFEQARSGSSEMRDVVEPALARWDHRPARAMWLDRLAADAQTPLRSLVLAIRGLAAVGEGKAADRLLELVLSERTPRLIRLESARALAVLRTEGLEKDAEKLGSDNVGRLLAVSLLGRHKSKESIRLLQLWIKEPPRGGLAGNKIDPEPAVVALAAGRLIEIDPNLVVPALPYLLGHDDARLRSLAVEVLFRLPTPKHLAALVEKWDDPDPVVRGKARRALHDLALKKELRQPIITLATKTLATGNARSLEQAAILLVGLDHKPAAARLVELLSFDRPEVFVTAAWGLRKLAVAETLSAILAHVKAEHGRLRAGEKAPGREKVSFEWVDHQVSQLIQLLGRQTYAPADAVLRQFIPRGAKGDIQESRAAAIWALGLLHEDKVVSAVATALTARLEDSTSIPPEDMRVRRMSAITLGRMKAKTATAALRRFFTAGEPSFDVINNACGWALGRITGKAMPAPKTIHRGILEGFLVPID